VIISFTFYCFVYEVKGRDIPSIYAVDSTDEEDWEKNVRLPSSELITSFLRVFSKVCYDIFLKIVLICSKSPESLL